MSDLATLSAAPRTDVIPGYTLSPARLPDFAMVEQELARSHVANAGAAAVGLPDRIGQMVIDAATNDVAAGRFKYGGAAFDAHVKSATFVPFLLHLTLRKQHPSTTREQATALVTDESEVRITRAVLELFGYKFPGTREDESKKATAAENGTGQPSTPPSDGPPTA